MIERTGADSPMPEIPLDVLNGELRGALAETMRIEVLEAGRGRVVARMPVDGNTQPYGLLHGGASVVLAETVGSIAATIAAGEGRVAMGLDINSTHHRAARAGFVTATATALSEGRSVASYDIAIVDDESRRVNTSRLTCVLRDAPRQAD